MANDSNKMISDFTDKPMTQSFLTAIAEYTASLGQVAKETKAQVSYAVNRKFLWLWAYETTSDGVLYLNVTLDPKVDDPHIHKVTHVSTNQWNHVEAKSETIANSGWLHDLIRRGYEFARS